MVDFWILAIAAGAWLVFLFVMICRFSGTGLPAEPTGLSVCPECECEPAIGDYGGTHDFRCFCATKGCRFEQCGTMKYRHRYQAMDAWNSLVELWAHTPSRPTRADHDRFSVLSVSPWWIALLSLALIGCGDRKPADIASDLKKNINRLEPLAAETAGLKSKTIKAISEAQACLPELEALERRLQAAIGGHIPAPLPPPGPSPLPPQPAPAPVPPPAPTPQPAPDQSRFHITADVAKWAASVGRPQDTHYFVAAAEAIADELRDGKITGFNSTLLGLAVKSAIGRHNVGIPKEVLDAWRDKFFANVNLKLNQLYSAGEFTKPADWEAFFREAIQGLKAAAP